MQGGKKDPSSGFRPVSRTSAVDGVIQQITALIAGREEGERARLPSERQLAETLGVSRPTLREALRTLAALGVLDTRQGAGTAVASSGAAVLQRPLELLLLLDRPSVVELQETRELVEVFLAGRAAERRGREDLDALGAVLAQMRACTNDVEAFVALDARFHALVHRAAGNVILQHLLGSLGETMRALMKSAAEAEADLAISCKEHERIFEAVRAGDAAAARRAMAAHMETVSAELAAIGARAKAADGEA